MKKIYFFMMLLSASFMTVQATNYFTIGGAVNDSLRINPLFLNNAVTINFLAHFDARVDSWHLTIDYPDGLSASNPSLLSGMQIPFKNWKGEDTICTAVLYCNLSFTDIMTSISEFGYYDPDHDGHYDSYGTVKWEAGDYEMFSLSLSLNSAFRGDTIKIDGLLSSTHDWRGNTVGDGVTFYKEIYVYVGYQRGDVDGNGILNITDVTCLMDYLLSPDNHPLDEFQLAAADVNGDGFVNISDVTALMNILQSNGLTDIDFPELDI